MQFPKSNADMPFFNWSSGFILSEDNIVAKKFEPLITLEFIYEVISGLIWFFNSVGDILPQLPVSKQLLQIKLFSTVSYGHLA